MFYPVQCVCRDDFLTAQDCRNLALGLASELYQLAEQDAQSVRLWVKSNPDKVVLYQEYTETEAGSPGTPLILCIQDPWQLDAMLKHGHQDALSFDATFGTNKFRVRILLLSAFCLVVWA